MVSLGPVNLPVSLIIAIVIYLAVWLYGRVILRADKDKLKIFSEILSSPILPFFLGWKLSPIITDFPDIIEDPLLLLYTTGGTLNMLAGILCGGIWMAFRWHRIRPGRQIGKTLIVSLTLAAVAGLVIGGAGIMRGNSTEAGILPEGMVLSTEDGSSWTRDSDRGSPVVLNFWASWCPPCRAEMPMLDRLAGDRRFEDVAFYAVNATRTEKSADDGINWIRAENYEIPLLFDLTGQASASLEINSLPTTLVLDRSGNIIAIKTGAVSRSWLVGALRSARKSGGSE